MSDDLDASHPEQRAGTALNSKTWYSTLGSRPALTSEFGCYQSLPVVTRPVPLELLGRGGMGVVHLVHDEALKREVAVKRLSDSLTDDASRRRFVREARITALLQHPNIVPVHALAVDLEGIPLFTMQVVDGWNLRRWLAHPKRTVKSRERVEGGIEVLLRVCDALAFAHARGICHRDIKPENVLVGAHGRVYLVEWGLASERNKREGGIVGTPAYMAPEQARGEVTDERADVFGLGALLYEIASGEPPYGTLEPDAAFRAARGEVVPITNTRAAASISPRIQDVVHRATAPNQRDRYASVIEFQDELRSLLRGGFHLPRRSYPAGRVIVKQGDPGDSAFLIVEGTCRVVQQTAQGDRELRRMQAGEVFGELALVLGAPRSANVIAEQDVELIVIGRDALEANDIHEGWSGALLRALAERFSALEADSAAQSGA